MLWFGVLVLLSWIIGPAIVLAAVLLIALSVIRLLNRTWWDPDWRAHRRRMELPDPASVDLARWSPQGQVENLSYKEDGAAGSGVRES
jgi:hypothetical protein